MAGLQIMVIGIAGGIGTGKSFLGRRLSQMKNVLLFVEADKVAHRLYQPGSLTHSMIVSAFGLEILHNNNYIDRRKLGALVFSSDTEMKKLTDIVWPKMKSLLKCFIERIKNQLHSMLDNVADEVSELDERAYEEGINYIVETMIGEIELDKLFQTKTTTADHRCLYIVIEAAVLTQANWFELFDGVIVCEVLKSVAFDRVLRRDGISEDQIIGRMNQHLSSAEVVNLLQYHSIPAVVLDTHRDIDEDYDNIIKVFLNKLFEMKQIEKQN